jgi:dipeptidyl aminopeptidase/acylaminoacyl peptidase
MKFQNRILLSILISVTTTLISGAQEKKALTISDLMKFRHIASPSVSRDGNWVAHSVNPDRGDPEVRVYSTDGKEEYIIQRGDKPVISNDGKWVAAVHQVPAEDLLKKDKAKGGVKPEPGLALLNTSNGEISIYKNVKSFLFSNNSQWLVYHALKEPEEESGEKNGNGKKDAEGKEGTDLYMVSLLDKDYEKLNFVTGYSIDSISHYMAVAVTDSNGNGNGVYIVDFEGDVTRPAPVFADSSAWGDYFSWNKRTGQLAFLAGVLDPKKKREDAQLFLWSAGKERAEAILGDEDLAGDWKLYHKNRLSFSRDGKRLFLGIKPGSEIIQPEENSNDSVSKVFNTEAILSDRTLDVWHWNDPYINPNQKKRWERIRERTYTGVYHLGSGNFVPLADEQMPVVRITNCPSVLLGSSDVPYAKRVTWDGRYNDYYLVDLETGERKLVLENQQHTVRLSPDGKYLVYYRSGDWHLMETATLKTRNLTEGLEVSFADEDWDYPQDVPGYGTGGWIDVSGAVLVYDKYDIWQFPTGGGDPVCLTEGKGRNGKLQFRVKRLDTRKDYMESEETVLLTAYHDLEKYTAIYSMQAGTPGVTSLAEEPRQFTLLAKARDADRVLYTRESYTEYPDLWITDRSFRKPRKLSDVNPQIEEFAWGEAELVQWRSADGIPLQGVLIKPGNYQPGEKYPVLLYYYRFFSQRLHDFNQVVVNHRPCFPFYASHGYAVFLPDIRFDIGNPGYAATKCLVPGVQKLIDMGIADPDAICLHGHSWSGYQTAFVITQTDIFACAIAGAPVSNMTSAYSGIRWGTGLARQFQYEKSQSRIGASLWEARDKYIENSPVFFADRVNTPLLIQFGDLDEAVPWYQGIELYLAMRRLGKDCIFLQYRGEPHHLKQYANKLDYTLKFKAYLDHYLKGEPAPEWIKNGIPYKGD